MILNCKALCTNVCTIVHEMVIQHPTFAKVTVLCEMIVLFRQFVHVGLQL